MLSSDSDSADPTVHGHPVPAGPVVVPPPDPERDARRDVYRDRERRRATAALNRYIEALWGDEGPDFGRITGAAGDRFIEAVGDYVLARVVEGICPRPEAHMAAEYRGEWPPLRTEVTDEPKLIVGVASSPTPEQLEEFRARLHQYGDQSNALLDEPGAGVDDVYECWGCSFRTVSGERFTGHLEATGHADGELHQKAGYGVAGETECDVFPGLACNPKREQCQAFCIRQGPGHRNPDYVPLRVTDESAVHVPHRHSSAADACSRIECHTLGIDGTSCVFCGGQPCRVVLV